MTHGICKNHPGRTAIGICGHCHMPLCKDCAVSIPEVPGRVFCGNEHAQAFAEYEKRLGGKRLHGRRLPSFFSYILWLAAIAAASYFVGKLVFGIDIIAEIKSRM